MQIPLDRLLLETDAPDGRPSLNEPYSTRLHSMAEAPQGAEQSKSNHPANIRYVLERVTVVLCYLQLKSALNLSGLTNDAVHHEQHAEASKLVCCLVKAD